MRSRKTYRVLVVGTDKDTRQKLVEYYLSRLKRSNVRNMVYKAKSITEVQRKIVSSLEFHLIVFPKNFPESEREELREWLSYIRQAITFIMVPLELIDKPVVKI